MNKKRGFIQALAIVIISLVVSGAVLYSSKLTRDRFTFLSRATQSTCGKICVYTQLDPDGQYRNYEGNCLDNSQNCQFNVNCGWVAGCSSGRLVEGDPTAYDNGRASAAGQTNICPQWDWDRAAEGCLGSSNQAGCICQNLNTTFCAPVGGDCVANKWDNTWGCRRTAVCQTISPSATSTLAPAVAPRSVAPIADATPTPGGEINQCGPTDNGLCLTSRQEVIANCRMEGGEGGNYQCADNADPPQYCVNTNINRCRPNNAPTTPYICKRVSCQETFAPTPAAANYFYAKYLNDIDDVYYYQTQNDCELGQNRFLNYRTFNNPGKICHQVAPTATPTPVPTAVPPTPNSTLTPRVRRIAIQNTTNNLIRINSIGITGGDNFVFPNLITNNDAGKTIFPEQTKPVHNAFSEPGDFCTANEGATINLTIWFDGFLFPNVRWAHELQVPCRHQESEDDASILIVR